MPWILYIIDENKTSLSYSWKSNEETDKKYLCGVQRHGHRKRLYTTTDLRNFTMISDINNIHKH